MAMSMLNYPLEKGYIHNWLVAGPQAIQVTNLENFSGLDFKLQIIRHYHELHPKIIGEPVEYGDFLIDDFSGKWNYIRCKEDHFIDLSVFHHITHYLRAFAYTELYSPKDQNVTMILTTNGPADLYVNGEFAHRQEHFYHQLPNRVKCSVSLKEGYNQILLQMEAVAARECPFSAALQVVDYQLPESQIEKAVQIPTLAPNALRRMALELLFEAITIRQDVFTREEPVRVYMPEGPASATDMLMRLQKPSGDIYAEAIRHRKMNIYTEFGHTYEFPEGAYQVILMPPAREYYEKNTRITRAMNIYLQHNQYATEPYGDFYQRRIEALQDAAHRQVNVFSEIAKMELGWWDQLNTDVFLSTIDRINKRGDCSDFYLVGLLGMIYRYGSNPDFPEKLRQPLEECILNFKYWHDEPGSDAMCYTTENHSILFHTCEVLAGQLYPDRIFSNINQNGKWHQEKGERLSIEWLKNRAKYGFKEWDSNCYFEEDTLALTHLASLATTKDVWELASVVLDKLFFTMAVNSYKGVFGSTHGRTYTQFIKGGFREATSGISRILWGMGVFTDHILGTVSLACSSYELPPLIAQIAQDLPAEMWNREQHTGSQYEFISSGSRGTAINKVTYKTPDYMLCSAQDWFPGEKGYQQHIWQATMGPSAVVFTTHPVCSSEDGSHRPNFWHGNETLPRVAQWKDVLIAIYNLPEDDWMGFTHAYFPVHGFDNYDIRDEWAFARKGDGYLALYAAKGLSFMTKGDNAYREIRSFGEKNVWVCQMGRREIDGSFEQFIQKVESLPLEVVDTQVRFSSLRGDQIEFAWKGEFQVNGKKQAITGFKHYENPYCTQELGANAMEIRYDDTLLRLNFETQS